MRFTESEIRWATRLRGMGLMWDPMPGHYVFDIDGTMKASSPFQAGVYLVTSATSIEAAAGGEQELRAGFAWLLTWEDARAWLADHEVSADQLVEALRSGLADGLTDREALYRLMFEILENPPGEDSCG